MFFTADLICDIGWKVPFLLKKHMVRSTVNYKATLRQSYELL